MDCIDIISLLKAHNGKLDNVRVYGYIQDKLGRPDNLFSNVIEQDGGIYVRFSCLAIDLSYYKCFLRENGIENSDCKYLIHGDILLYVDGGTVIPDWYSVYGTLRFGTKITTDYVTMLIFGKSNNSWAILKNGLDNIDSDEEFSHTIKDIVDGVSDIPNSLYDIQPMRASMSLNNEIGKLPLEKNIYFNNTDVKSFGEDRGKVKELSNNLEIYQDILDKAECKSRNTFSQIKSKYTLQDGESYCIDLLSRLKANLKHKATESTMTGASLIKKYLQTYGGISNKKYLGVDVKKFLVDSFPEVADYAITGNIPILDGVAWTLCERAFSDLEIIYVGILEAILGVSLQKAREILNGYNISIVSIINNNPYILFLHGYISFNDAEYLALMFNLSGSSRLERYKNTCILHEYTLHSDCNDTVYKISDMSNLGVSSRTVSKVASATMKCFFTDVLVTGYNTSGWTKQYNNSFKKIMTRMQIETAISDYIGTGIGVVIDDYITATSILKKELYVYTELQKLGGICNDYSDEDIDKYITEYEDMVGFKLEKEQRNAVFDIKYNASCLSGSAGSGKTTTVGCIVYVIRKLNPYIDIRFCTPTGKAAKVLQGVVKESVRTLHSVCGIGLDVSDDDSMGNACSTDYFIIDEMSMVTLDLMYTCLRRLNGVHGFYFVGDINQLPSIGKGLVFKNLLRFLPCTFLKVSKRSKEGSGIALNSDRINNHSTKETWEDLENKSDFNIIPCSDEKIQQMVVDLSKELIHKGVSDIQIVTPIVKATYSWGAYQLNKVLQPIFNSNRNVNDRIYIGNTLFIKGDKVIHSKTNSYGMQWYKTHEGGNFQKIYGCGVSNGEVGRFVGVYPVDICTFYDEDEEKPEDFVYYNNMRDDSTYDIKNGYFAVVEYEDCASNNKYYILYRLAMYDEGVLTGKDLGLLDLFYAGSTHKLQGSQSDIVICCIGTINSKGFMTRNMLYTMVTRGKERVYVIGSESQLIRSRLESADEGVLTIGELLST